MAALPFVAFWLVLAGALLAYPASQHAAGWRWLETVRLEALAACQHPDTQWLAAVCAGIYFGGFLYLSHLLLNLPVWQSPRSLLVLIFAGWAAWVYARDYPASAARGDFLVLLSAMAAGQGVAFWLIWEARRARARRVAEFVLGSLVVALGTASLIHPDVGMAYQYRGVARWKGLWDTPNTFGVLMAAGLVLAVGLAGRALAATTAGQGRRTRWLRVAVWVFCAASMGTALLRSYSRGAWLGAGLGLGWLGWVWLRSAAENSASASPALRIVRACAPAWLLAAAAASVLAFWSLRHTESPLVRRAFTVGNMNDFSWRNRVATWPGALEAISRKPLVGWGWGRPANVFEHGHKPVALSEGGAVTLNNYLMVGMMLGAPALIALVSWLWLGWRTEDVGRPTAGPPIEMEPVRRICQAALIPCAVGMGLDGVLFKAAVAVPMFILIELGASTRDSGVGQTQSRQSPAPSH